MAETKREYALGRSDREYARLALQADLLKPLTRRVFEDAGIAPGMRVLDLGSGAGDVCLLLSEMVGPEGAVIGLDVDAGTVAHARQRVLEMGVRNIEFEQADLAQYVPAAPVDAVVGRLVLCYLPEPAAVLAAVAKHLRPHGILAFQEPWMMPMTATDLLVQRIARCMVETLRLSGAQVDIGARLHHVFRAAGLPQPTMRFEAVMDGREDTPITKYITETLTSILPKAVEYGVAALGDFDLDGLEEGLRAERKAIGYAMMTLPLVAAWCRMPVSGPTAGQQI
jgi:ubiquinone/menaquinone biosynthesis C-methylase UbiE